MAPRDEMRQELARRLKRARGYGMYTQGDLARRLGISRRAVAGYELDENEPPMTVVLTWLKACDRPLSDLDDIMALVEIPDEDTIEALEDPLRADLGLAADSDRPLDGDLARQVLDAPKSNRPSPPIGLDD